MKTVQPAKQRVRSKLPQLDLFRAFALFGVISVHSSSTAAAVSALHSKYFPIFNIMNIFFKFGTPCFIFLSSFVLFYNYYDRSDTGSLIRKFYRKRLLYIIVPYVLISLVYFVFNHQMNHKPWMGFNSEFSSLVNKLATGSAHTHLYFVFVNAQFYLLFPLVLVVLKRFKSLSAWAFPIGMMLQWGYVLLNHYYHYQWMPKGSLSVSYASYYLLGASLAIYYERWHGWMVRGWQERRKSDRCTVIGLLMIWFAVSGAHVAIWHSYRIYHTSYNTLWYELLWNVQTLLTAFVLLLAAFQLHRLFEGKLLYRTLAVIGQLSFGIYLVHPIVLAIYRKYSFGISTFVKEYVFWIWGGYAAALVISIVVVHLAFRFIPNAWMLLGSEPAYIAAAKKERAIIQSQSPFQNGETVSESR
ncbi:surface polysaccharide O-acyltransferase-like enzyme [Paenibacillus cellulosilyticus]|uniref:Surface polysaccharide O-acyltransferase-like enzyme n=1 Tax=Paenibacillus cellulosilyticus TaxID=375489 RepID=A0A2V2YX89_9BACL|nr:acyltransferase [Paenibacillus cellulosilyticus]PWW05705.1 surface polysaccharide O-acyltransferase-like enzyme [Paenibacillus cellulosilyticus]QKS45277.1 acyltransferase [Paenibacillus cellulosilyticus]